VVVEVVLVAHPGTRTREPVSTRIVRNPHAFLARGLLPLPTAMNPSRGNASHNPYNTRECRAAPVVTGPKVLIVSVELMGVPFTCRPVPCGENEHTGAIVTSGLIVAHASVIPPLGERYPLIGFIVTTPVAPLPAGTLVGATEVATLIVNWGVTASTVNGSAGVVKLVVGPVPVIVTLYPTVVVVLNVVIVAVAVAGTVTDCGLTVHTGVSVVCCDDVTWQLRLTVPLNPLTDPTWIVEDDVPPGAMASGLNDEACRVNSDVPCWACANETDRQATASAAAIRQADIPARRPLIDFTLDSNHPDLNMHEFWFK